MLLLLLIFSPVVELEFSLDLGLTWKPLVRDCLPTSPDCSSYTLQRLLVADTYNKWGRLTMPIPSYARSVFAAQCMPHILGSTMVNASDWPDLAHVCLNGRGARRICKDK